MMKMRRIVWVPSLLAGLLLLFGLNLVGGLFRASGNESSEVELEIVSGATLRSVADQLVAEGILDQAWRLRLAARLRRGSQVKSGRYALHAGMSPMEILRVLDRGEVLTAAVSLPEGWSASRIAEELEAKGLKFTRNWCKRPPHHRFVFSWVSSTKDVEILIAACRETKRIG